MGATELNLARVWAGLADGSRIHAILQFDLAPNSASRENLSSMGVRVLGYLPENAFFAGIPRGVSADDLKRAGVAWAGAVYPEDKLPPRVQASGVGLWALRADGAANLWVHYYPDVSPDHAVADLAQFEARVVGLDEKLNRITVGAPLNRIAAIAARDWVRWIEEVPPPPQTYNDGARANVQANTVQTAPYDLSGAGVVLGIWDAGSVDSTHEDFAGRLVLAETNTGAQFHATHVAGTMAGSGQHSLAAGGTDRQWRGIAPGSSIVSYEFGNPVGKHDEAINVYHVVLSQNSWGVQISESIGSCGLLGEYGHMASDYDRIITGLYGKPINVVFAAGNERAQEPGSCQTGPYVTIGPPATAKDVITVGAINSDDDSMTTFSSWGPVRDGRLKPELVAPGAEVGNEHGITSTLPGPRYGVLSGTSMATPVVSGAIALLVEDYRGHYNNQDPLPSTMKGLLVHTAVDLEDDTSWYNKGPDFASGYGRVQIQDAVEQLRRQGFLIGQVGDRATNTYALAVPQGAAVVKVTLVWDDPPAMDNAAIALVNDLDLIVLDPDGQRFYPWTLDPANPSLPASKDKEDHLNVIEQVVADGNPASGDWTIRVVGRNVPVAAPQKYTLLFTPTTIPVPPGIVMEQAVFSDANSDAANNNGFIDPGERIAEMIVLRNTAGPAATNVTATIQADFPGIELLQASSEYPNMAAGVAATNATPFAYRVPKTIACGTPITLTCVASANGFLFTNTFARVVGQFTVTNVVTNVCSLFNRRPDVSDQSVTLMYGVATNLALAGGDPDNDPVIFSVESRPAHGALTDLDAGAGTVTYTPDGGYSGPDAFSYVVTDGYTNSVIATVVIEVKFDADLAVSLSATPDPVLVQGLFSYTIEITNQGPHTATAVRLADELPGAVNFVSLQTSLGRGTNDNGTVRCELGDLALGSHALVTLVVQPTALGLLTNRVSVSAEEIDVNPADNLAAAVVTVMPVAELAVSQQPGMETALLGQPLTLVLTVANLGPSEATGARLEDVLPPELNFVSVRTSQGSATNDNGIVRCELGTLAIGSNTTVTVQVVPTIVGLVTNTVVVSATETDLESISRLVVMVVDTPTLQFERSQNRLFLWWPLVAQDFILEVTDTLLPSVSWTQERNAHVVVGDRVTITIKMSTTARYYRLRKP